MDIMTTPRIAISEDVAGGKPRIAGHRITVQHIVIWHERMGLSADEIASNHRIELGRDLCRADVLLRSPSGD